MAPTTEQRGNALKRLLALVALTVAFVTLTPVPPSVAASGGPVVVTGIDAEDGGPGAHGPIANYVTLVSSILNGVGTV